FLPAFHSVLFPPTSTIFFNLHPTEGIDPETNQKISLFNPRQQPWDDHFKWSDDNTELVGKTPDARATILILRLNRPGIVNLRRLLITVNLHPPI
ncbi:MAG: hypothetical protein ACKO4S_18265, partial [Snowella sp.]